MNSKFKNIIIAIAIFTACVLTLGIFLGVGYSYGWFTAADEAENEAAVAQNVIMNNGSSNGIMLTSKTLYDDGDDLTRKDNSDTYEVTATITPANTSDQSVTMSVAWADASGDWATGKDVSDYVTITQESEGALTGTLACTQAFGEQIILTVTLDSDATVNATATVDYVARFSHYEPTGTFMSWGNVIDSQYNFGNYLFVDSTAYYDTGTIYGEFTEATVYFDLVNDEEYYSDFIFGFLVPYVADYINENNLDLEFAEFAAIELGTLADGAIDSSGNVTLEAGDGYKQVIVADSFMDFVAAMIPDATQTQLNEFEANYLNTIISDFIEDYNNGDIYRAVVTVEYTYSYNGTVYGTGKIIAESGDIGIEGLTVSGTGVLLNDGSFTF